MAMLNNQRVLEKKTQYGIESIWFTSKSTIVDC